jgi:hypothetical protein
MADWKALLRRPEDDQDRHQLEQDVARLTGERDQTKAQLKGAQERAEEAWLAKVTEARVATIEGAMARLQGQLETITTDLAAAEQKLAIARSRPTSVEAATQLSDRIRSFRMSLPTATPAERLAFNRWLLSRQPAIEFKVHPKPVAGGDRLVELFLGGQRVSYAPLAGLARVLAWEQGMVDPALVAEEHLPSGHVAALLIERPEMGSDPAAWLEKAGHLLVVNPAKPLEEATSWQLEHSYSLDLDSGDGDDGAEPQGEESNDRGGDGGGGMSRRAQRDEGAA